MSGWFDVKLHYSGTLPDGNGQTIGRNKNPLDIIFFMAFPFTLFVHPPSTDFGRRALCALVYFTEPPGLALYARHRLVPI